jgi:ABC-type cobalt transport system substrate-binding protein
MWWGNWAGNHVTVEHKTWSVTGANMKATLKQKILMLTLILHTLILLYAGVSYASFLGSSDSPEMIYSEQIAMISLGIGLLGVAGLFKRLFRPHSRSTNSLLVHIDSGADLPEKS